MDTTQATVRQIVARKPDGSRLEWLALQEATTSIKYVTGVGDLDMSGVWKLQAYVEVGPWKGFGEITDFEVKNPL